MQEFAARRVVNARYSLRAFANLLGVDHATLSQFGGANGKCLSSASDRGRESCGSHLRRLQSMRPLRGLQTRKHERPTKR